MGLACRIQVWILIFHLFRVIHIQGDLLGLLSVTQKWFKHILHADKRPSPLGLAGSHKMKPCFDQGVLQLVI